ncbi:hypothetical protein [Prosthecobacter sp.]|uniref:hypothetical protein n=1 Tax=Prosthecobacter sp. TaxID=1965333 RepID=UPI0037832336
MLVKNDFLSHWKTKLLCLRIGDGPALRALLSLWSYCEQRRAWQFKLTPLELAGVCDFGGDHQQLYRHLLELRFIMEKDDGFWEVNGWGEQNSSLIHKWPGRRLQDDECYHAQGFVCKRIAKPKPQPIAQPSPPAIGAAIPLAIGLDRIGLDRKEPPLSPKGGNAAEAAVADLADYGVEHPDSGTEDPPGKKKKGGRVLLDLEWPEDWQGERMAIMQEWLRYKAERRQGYKPTGFAVLLRKMAGLTAAQLREVVDASMVNGWTGLFPERLAGAAHPSHPARKPAPEVAIEEQSLLNVDAADFEPEGWRDVWPEITDAPLPREFADVPPALRSRLIDECEKGEGGAAL